MLKRPFSIWIAVILFISAGPLTAEVTRIEVAARQAVLDGKEFGLAGGYEKLNGTIHFAVNPQNTSNRIVTDIDKAPLDENGRVAFHAEFYLIKPIDMTKGNGAVLFEVGNRGGKGLLRYFNFSSGSSDPTTAEHFGDGFLLREGFSLLWVGWQWDTPERAERMRMYVPIATDKGKLIRGLVRSDFVPTEHESDHSLSDRNHIPYPVADEKAKENVLTIRRGVEAARTTIPREQWGFGRIKDGRVVPDKGRVYLKGGFEPGNIYEVVYVSENPPLVGLGPTGIRDTLSFIKYGSPEALGIPEGAIDRALAFGVSQSGRFLRTFLYYGFNKDEAERRVFDGVIADVAGGGRGSFNHRFAQASRDAHPYLNMFYPTDIFPFTGVEQKDPKTGLSDGLLAHQGEAFLPKVFYTNSSYEYWGRAASLIHTSIDGTEDASIMDNVRIYMFAGTQHGPAQFPPGRTRGQQLANPLNFRWSMRALLKRMDQWVKEGTTPPESRYPRIEAGTAVIPDELGFPTIPGVTTSTRLHKAYRADYGPRFRSEGVVTQQPPKIGVAFPMMVSSVDADGNELAGVRLPEQIVPLATYTGWNLFNEESGPTDELSSMVGSFIPFTRTKKEREARGDPRLSIQERYASREDYLGRITEAALELIEAGYLLRRDLPALAQQALRSWDYILELAPPTNFSPDAEQ